MTDLERAQSLLSGGVTLALAKGERTHVSGKRGIAPLLEILEAGDSFRGFSAADLVVGRAAAFLYGLIGVKEVYAAAMSAGAEKIFAEYGIGAVCKVRTESIMNRAGTGPCPMEEAVAGISDPVEAYAALRAKAASLKRSG